MVTPTFNAATQPWIPTLGADDVERTLSLADLFERMDSPETDGELATGIPAGDQALWERLLLPLVYTAVGSPVVDDDVPDFTAVARWIRDHADRFELTDPDAPFLQCGADDLDNLLHVSNLRPWDALNRPQMSKPLAYLRDTMTVEQAVLALAISQGAGRAGIPSGTPGVSSGKAAQTSSREGPLFSRTSYRPDGLLGQTLGLAWLRVDNPGEAMLTWADPDALDLTAEAQLLSLHSRRVRLSFNEDGLVNGIFLSRENRTFDRKLLGMCGENDKDAQQWARGYPVVTADGDIHTGTRTRLYATSEPVEHKNVMRYPLVGQPGYGDGASDPLTLATGGRGIAETFGAAELATKLADQPSWSLAARIPAGRFRVVVPLTKQATSYSHVDFVVDTREVEASAQAMRTRKVATAAAEAAQFMDRKTAHRRTGELLDAPIPAGNPRSGGDVWEAIQRLAHIPSADQLLIHDLAEETYWPKSALTEAAEPASGRGLYDGGRSLTEVWSERFKAGDSKDDVEAAVAAERYKSMVAALPEKLSLRPFEVESAFGDFVAEEPQRRQGGLAYIAANRARANALAEIFIRRVPTHEDLVRLGVFDEYNADHAQASGGLRYALGLMAHYALGRLEFHDPTMLASKGRWIRDGEESLVAVARRVLTTGHAAWGNARLGGLSRFQNPESTLSLAAALRRAGLDSEEVRRHLATVVYRAGAENQGLSWLGLIDDVDAESQSVDEGWAQALLLIHEPVPQVPDFAGIDDADRAVRAEVEATGKGKIPSLGSLVVSLAQDRQKEERGTAAKSDPQPASA